eukprot:TRINITY_DN3787_c0_g1_i1.p1 TRINITY_DN3787_c0_g1~~TRINITY_DN3787_c0_g1_i1.p1  ORF type:complete len:375 (-),score=68.05 TRINITY_DN3787_c0_g1_i1:46-1170(-)
MSDIHGSYSVMLTEVIPAFAILVCMLLWKPPCSKQFARTLLRPYGLATGSGSSGGLGSGGVGSGGIGSGSEEDYLFSWGSIVQDPMFKFIPYAHLRLGKCIGRGSFGTVHQGDWNNRSVAIKVLNDPPGTHGSLQPGTIREIKVLGSLMNPRLLTFYGISVDRSRSLCLVVELMNKGSVKDVMEHDTLDWSTRLRMALDVACGMAYIHSQNVIHRDLKPENILVDANYRAKVADLGTCRLVSHNAISSTESVTRCVGTFKYMAPEVYTTNYYTASADVYSFAVVLLYLSTGVQPYAEYGDLPSFVLQQRVVTDHLRPRIPDNFPDDLRQMILEGWAHVPTQRPSFAQLQRRLRSFIVTQRRDATTVGEEGLLDL